MKTHFYHNILFIILTLSGIGSFAQGSLMLAGGAGETSGGWSDAPYRWVVEHAVNKRIAIITYDAAATDWIPNYFKGFGAKAAKNIIIASRSTADQQWVYDTLITYDGVFIKGGDQSKYYEYYKGTKTQQALQHIYDKGGVLSGTSAGTAILSPIVYTATLASVDPAAALQNAYTSQITLAKDFVNTLPKKYIIDTHFAERGRFGRICAFLASWYRQTGETAIGIGIDDHTALCISPDGKANVYGTGSVGFYYNQAAELAFDTTATMLAAGNMKFTQLTHGCTIDLNTEVSSGLNTVIQPQPEEENARQTILLSGTDYPSDEAYNHLVNDRGSKTDAIVIVTGSDVSRANDAKLKMLAKGAAEVYVVQAITAFQNDAAMAENIAKASKLFVISNDYSGFMSFIGGTGNGSLLLDKIKQPGMICFFAGDNARFAGKTVIDKYTGAGYTSYHGTLEFKPGLGLLNTTAIMPNAFISADTYENTVTGLPYAMVTHSLAFGLYITANTCVEYGYTPERTSYFRNVSGSSPLIFLHNAGTLTGLANQGPYNTSRNIAGFQSMNLAFVPVSGSVTVGSNVILSATQPEIPIIKMYPNPAKDIFHITGCGSSYALQVSDLNGRVVYTGNFVDRTDVNLSAFNQGLYLVSICNLKTRACTRAQLTLIK